MGYLNDPSDTITISASREWWAALLSQEEEATRELAAELADQGVVLDVASSASRHYGPIVVSEAAVARVREVLASKGQPLPEPPLQLDAFEGEA